METKPCYNTTHTVTYTSTATVQPTVSHYASAEAAYYAAAAFILRGQYDTANCTEDATDVQCFRLRREMKAECWSCGGECPAPEDNEEKPLCAECEDVERLRREGRYPPRRSEQPPVRIPVELHNDTPFDTKEEVVGL